MAALQRYRWPGNVRELQNVIERAVLLGKGEVIGIDNLPGSLTLDSPGGLDQIANRKLKEALHAGAADYPPSARIPSLEPACSRHRPWASTARRFTRR